MTDYIQGPITYAIFKDIGGSDSTNTEEYYDITDVPTSTLDPWHYADKGDSTQGNSVGLDFIKQCQAKLPQIDLPIAIGWTGYVNPKDDSHLENKPNCWCYDALGRVVLLLYNHILFQRYQNSGIIMISKLPGWCYYPMCDDHIKSYLNSINHEKSD